ncbi:MAG: M50 family metallopeptidase [Peptococcaceae bacterium]|nr:M50 family metallopeptidase [Peptococcaceae bacterium]
MKIGRFFGINIYLNPFFLALLGLFFVAGILDKGLIAFGVVLVHEFAHALAARRLGVTVADVELLPFGGVTRMSGEMPVHPRKEIFIAAAGPAGNLALFLAGTACKNYGLWDDTLGPFFLQCNMVIAAFNTLPALPLDGGRVYRAYLAGKIGLKNATYRAAGLGQALAVLVILAGAAGLAFGWSGLDILITGLFLFYAATRERAAAPYLFMRHMMQKKDDLLQEGVIPAVMLAAREDTPLGEVVRHFMPQRFHFVAVFSDTLEFRGVLTEEKIVEGLFNFGLDHPVGRLEGLVR